MHEDSAFLTTLSLAFLVATAIYLIAYLFYGNIYRVWKWAGLIALPLSFVPTTAAFCALHRLSRHVFRHLHSVTLIGCLLFFIIKFIQIPSMVNIPIEYYKTQSGSPFISTIYKIKNSIPNNSTVYLDFSLFSQQFLALIIFNDPDLKIDIFNYYYYFRGLHDYFDNINESTYILSDFKYDNIYNGEKLDRKNGQINVYTYENLITNGYAVITTIPRKFSENSVIKKNFFKIKIPKKLTSPEITFSIDLVPQNELLEGCRSVELGVYDADAEETRWSTHDYDDVTVMAPASARERGELVAILSINQALDTSPRNGDASELPCKFQIERIRLEPSD
jgi:hypothetical protein